MDPLSEIRKSIKGMASGKGGAGLFTAKVLSTDGETCCVEIDGLVASDVRLRAVVNGEESGVLITPKTSSYVTVADLSGDLTQLMVVGFSEVEKIDINTDAKIVFLCCEKTKGVKQTLRATSLHNPKKPKRLWKKPN